MSPIKVRFVSSGKKWQSVLTEPSLLKTEVGARYVLLDQHDQPLQGLRWQRKGADLVLKLQQTTVLQLQDFYAPATQANLELASNNGVVLLSSANNYTEYTASRSESSSFIGWNATTALTLVAGVSLLAVASSQKKEQLFNTDSNHTTPSYNGNVVNGTIVAGPVLAQHGLSVVLYQADGVSELGRVKLDQNGRFSIRVDDYQGVVIAKVLDADNQADYRDEVGNTPKDLAITLFSVAVLEPGQQELNLSVNPLTTLAYQKMLQQNGNNTLGAALVKKTNQLLAAGFGLNDLQADVLAVNGEGYNQQDSVSAAERYGQVLATLSAFETKFNGNSQAAFDALVAGVSLEQQTLSISPALKQQLTEASQQQGVSINNPVPQFTSASQLSITENWPLQQVVLQPTLQSSSGVTFALTGADAAAFTIDASSGAIRLAQAADFEQKSRYTLTLQATNNLGLRSEQTLTIQVTNVDDMAPQFISPASSNRLNDNSFANTIVYQAETRDIADLTQGKTQYSLKPGEDAASFEIDAQTGSLRLLKTIDADQKQLYQLTLIATDAAGNAREFPLTLRANNLDDSAPQFTSGTTAAIDEHTDPTSQVIYQAQASDRGDGSDGKVFYSIRSNDSTGFNINRDTGEVLLSDNVDFVTKPSYQFTVIAEDKAGNRSEQAVNLTIRDLKPSAQLQVSTELVLRAPSVSEDSNQQPLIHKLDATGRFVLVWKTGNASNGIADAVWVQQFGANGQPETALIKLDNFGIEQPQVSAIKIDPVGDTGAYRLSWLSKGQSLQRIFASQAFNADGSLAGPVQKIKESTSGHEMHPGLTSLSNSSDLVFNYVHTPAEGPRQIFLQKIAANGSTQTPVALASLSFGEEGRAQLLNIGSEGLLAAWLVDTEQHNGIKLYLQKLNADLSATVEPLILAASTAGASIQAPQLLALGQSGNYLVAWVESYGESFVQLMSWQSGKKGQPIKLHVPDAQQPTANDVSMAALGNNGDFVLAWTGRDGNDNDINSILVQRFNANGQPQGSVIQLDGRPQTISNSDEKPRVFTFGSSGAFAVIWESAADEGWSSRSLMLQLFNADGSKRGQMIRLDGAADLSLPDTSPQISAVGNEGDYVVVWSGQLSSEGVGAYSIFLQKFNALGEPDLTAALNHNQQVSVSASEVGKVYLVHESLVPKAVAEITQAADTLWQEAAINMVDSPVSLTLTGLAAGRYHAYAADRSGNLSAISSNALILAEDKVAPTISLKTAEAALNHNQAAYLTSTELGQVYLVHESLNIKQLTDISGAADDLWQSMPTSVLGEQVAMPLLGLHAGKYYAYAVDNAGNLSAKSTTAISLAADTTPPQASLQLPAQALAHFIPNDSYNYLFQLAGATKNDAYILLWGAPPNASVNPNYLYAQRFNAEGKAQGDAWQIDNAGYDPKVTYLNAQGDFLLSWSKPESLTASRKPELYQRIFKADGSPITTTQTLTLEGFSFYDSYSIKQQVLSGDGDYLVAWHARNQNSEMHWVVQHFNADGSLVTSQALRLGSADQNTAILSLANGQYGLIYQAEDGAYLRQYQTDGQLIGSQSLSALGKTFWELVDSYPLADSAQILVLKMVQQDSSITYLMQKIKANGELEGSAMPLTRLTSDLQDVMPLANSSDILLAWSDSSTEKLHLQKRSANGEQSESLYSLPISNVGIDAQFTPLNNAGDFLLWWRQHDGESIALQRFNAALQPLGELNYLDARPAMSSTNDKAVIFVLPDSAGFIVNWYGEAVSDNPTVFQQRFDAQGKAVPLQNPIFSPTDAVSVSSNEPGELYLINRNISVNKLSDITAADGKLWNSVLLTQANQAHELSLAGLVDGEYQLYARDNANQLSPAAAQTLTVRSKPQFSSGNTAELTERSGDNQVVYTAQATDDSTLRYSLKTGADSQAFSIDESSGAVRLRQNADYETKAEYRFTVLATDQHQQVAERDVVLSIRDLDEKSYAAPTILPAASLLISNTSAYPTPQPKPQPSFWRDGEQYLMAWQQASEGHTNRRYAVQKYHTDTGTALWSEALTINITQVNGMSSIVNSAELDVLPLAASDQFVVARVTGYPINSDVLLQRYGADGRPIGDEVKLKRSADSNMQEVKVKLLALANGQFIALWQEAERHNPTERTLFYRYFDAEMKPQGDIKTLSNSRYVDRDLEAMILGDKLAIVGTQSQKVYLRLFDPQGEVAAHQAISETILAPGHSAYPQIVKVGKAGDFAVAWIGFDPTLGTAATLGIYWQLFNAQGVAQGSVKRLDLEQNLSVMVDEIATLTLTNGQVVLAWVTNLSATEQALYVLRLDQNGNALGAPKRMDQAQFISVPQLAAVGDANEFSLSWASKLAEQPSQARTQHFAADGSLEGVTVNLGLHFDFEIPPAALAYGDAGEYVVAWSNLLAKSTTENGVMPSVSWSYFDANGVAQSTKETYQRQDSVRVTTAGATGSLLVVHDSINPANLADIRATHSVFWNEQTIGAQLAVNEISLSGLANGQYHFYIANQVGELSPASIDSIVISDNSEPLPRNQTVVFDLLSGNSSEQTTRQFATDVSYQIYIRVPEANHQLKLNALNGWSGVENLGADDRLALVTGDSGLLAAANLLVNQLEWLPQQQQLDWQIGDASALTLSGDGQITRHYAGQQSQVDLWDGQLDLTQVIQTEGLYQVASEVLG